MPAIPESTPLDDGALLAGDGCIYPPDVRTIADRLTSTDLEAVRSYTDVPSGFDSAKLCDPPFSGKPVVARGGGVAPAQDDPLQWFEGFTGDVSNDPLNAKPSFCFKEQDPDGSPGVKSGMSRPLSVLKDDLKASDSDPTKLPALTILIPSRCVADASVTCPDGSPGGPAALDAFLKANITDTILTSKTYKTDGMVVIAHDTNKTPGAVVLSPYVKARTISRTAYNTYSLLKTIEDRLGLYATQNNPGKALGHSADKTVKAFGTDIFDRKLDPRPAPTV
jgi:hypothetical protein